MRTAIAVALTAALLCGCVHARTLRYEGAPEYGPTRASEIEVLTEIPPGAVVIGEVDGEDQGVFQSAMSHALDGAAELGANAVLVVGRGEEPVPGDPFFREREVIRLKALRVER